MALVIGALSRAPLGPYQIQAAIAAVHDEAPTAGDTDWSEILLLYGLLERAAPNPVVTLNRAVAVAMVHGPAAGLDVVDALTADDRLADHHRWHSVRAHLLEMAGDHEAPGPATWRRPAGPPACPSGATSRPGPHGCRSDRARLGTAPTDQSGPRRR